MYVCPYFLCLYLSYLFLCLGVPNTLKPPPSLFWLSPCTCESQPSLTVLTVKTLCSSFIRFFNQYLCGAGLSLVSATAPPPTTTDTLHSTQALTFLPSLPPVPCMVTTLTSPELQHHVLTCFHHLPRDTLLESPAPHTKPPLSPRA